MASLFLKLPKARVLDFTFMKFVEHVLDHSPVIETRSLQRRASGVVDHIEAAIRKGDEYAELPNPDDARFFAAAAAEVAIPRLVARPHGPDGAAVGDGLPIPARAYARFYEAFETMTEARPEEPKEAPELGRDRHESESENQALATAAE